MIAQTELKETLHYCPNTGIFTWIINKSGTAKGTTAGYKTSEGYSCITINYKPYRSHRLAWLYTHGEFPKDQIDHINGVKDDNRIENLRDVDGFINHKNKKLFKSNKSGITGVCWDKASNKWAVRISPNRVRISLGYFDNIFDAAAASISARNRYGFHENHGRR
jgi:hypothetical protein